MATLKPGIKAMCEPFWTGNWKPRKRPGTGQMMIHVCMWGNGALNLKLMGSIYGEEEGSEKKEIKKEIEKEKGTEQKGWKGGTVQNSSGFKGLYVSRSNLLGFFLYFPLSTLLVSSWNETAGKKTLQTQTTKYTHITKIHPRNLTNNPLFSHLVFWEEFFSQDSCHFLFVWFGLFNSLCSKNVFMLSRMMCFFC